MRKQISASLLALIITASAILPSCGGKADAEENTAEDTAGSADTAADAETKEPDKFDNIDLGGDKLRVWSSINDYDSTNAHDLIAGTGAENGEVVNDAVYMRNMEVEETLNIKLEFTPCDEDYVTNLEKMRSVIMSGEDLYDVIIQDMYREAQVVMEGMAIDMSQHPMLDFTQPYWMGDYMYDMSVDRQKVYIMAGDFFMGAIKSAHALYFNKTMMENIYGDPDAVYQTVLDGKWTCDALASYIEGAYSDLDGNSQVNMGDQLGFCCQGYWGSGMPFMLCGDLQWVQYVDGDLRLVLNENRAAKTLEAMNKVFWNTGTITTFDDEMWVPYFNNGLSLFLGYADLNTFSQLRENDFGVGILPYPKLDEEQERYVTVTHDTTETGIVPITSKKYDMIGTALEMLSREGQKTIMPAYYETALKVKYTSDNVSAQMLDIIHDNINASFFLAYNGYLGGNLITIFFTPIQKNSSDFASTYASVKPQIETGLEAMAATWAELGG